MQKISPKHHQYSKIGLVIQCSLHVSICRWRNLSLELVDTLSLVVKDTESVVRWGFGTGANLSKDLSQIVKSKWFSFDGYSELNVLVVVVGGPCGH